MLEWVGDTSESSYIFSLWDFAWLCLSVTEECSLSVSFPESPLLSSISVFLLT